MLCILHISVGPRQIHCRQGIRGSRLPSSLVDPKSGGVCPCSTGELPYVRDEVCDVSSFPCTPSLQIVESLTIVSVLHNELPAVFLFRIHYYSCIATNRLLLSIGWKSLKSSAGVKNGFIDWATDDPLLASGGHHWMAKLCRHEYEDATDITFLAVKGTISTIYKHASTNARRYTSARVLTQLHT
jgi:hypothetical protein